MSACECLTVCGWVLCNYLPWLGFLFWVHSEKFHTEIVCTDKIEVESFWLLIYLPMRSVWWKSPGSAHNHTQSQAITRRVTPAHTHAHSHIFIVVHTRTPSHPFRLFQSTVRSFFAYSKCISRQALLLSASQDVSFSCIPLLLQNFFFSFFFFAFIFFIFCSSYYTYLVMHCCSQLALRVESSAMPSW